MMITNRDLTQFLGMLGAKSIVVDAQRGWIRSSCPLAPWTHESGEDRHPSFGVKIPEVSSEVPCFTCFTCGHSGPLPALLSAYMQCSGDRMPEASAFLSKFELFKENGSTGEIPKHKRIRMTDHFVNVSLAPRPIYKNLPVPEEILAKYPPLWEKSDLNAHREALRWLMEERQIAFQPVGKYKLRLYVNELDDIGVIFPILDQDGETVLDMWVRQIDRKRFFRLTPEMAGSQVEYNAPNLLFGHHLMEDGSKPVILVEGPLDALRLASLGVQRVMATMGNISFSQIETFYARSVYLGFDNDEAGQTFTKKALHGLKVPAISILDWGIVNKKDAGELKDREEFIQVFNARTKILAAAKMKCRKIVFDTKLSKKKFLSQDGILV